MAPSLLTLTANVLLFLSRFAVVMLATVLALAPSSWSAPLLAPWTRLFPTRLTLQRTREPVKRTARMISQLNLIP